MNLYPTPEHQSAAESDCRVLHHYSRNRGSLLNLFMLLAARQAETVVWISLPLVKPETMSTAQADIQKIWGRILYN